MAVPERLTSPAPVPVLVGGDIGAYALVRAFYERFGVRGVVLAMRATKAFAHTRLAEVRVANVDDEESLIQELLTLARERKAAGRPADERLILLTNADHYVEAIVRNRARLEAHFAIPMCSPEALARVSSKKAFDEDCRALGIPVPEGVALDFSTANPGRDDTLLDSFTYPIFGKPSSSAEYYGVDFVGKQKVYHLETREDAASLLARLRGSGYRGVFMLQEFIPGDETQMRSLTAYRDSQGRVTLLCTGRVLLEEHTPGALGIPAAILTEPFPDAMDAITRYLDRIDYRGFANADYKWDARTGRHVFFEVNPRVGRNNYYATAAGADLAGHVAADVAGEPMEPVRASREVLYSVVPLRLLTRYLLDRGLRRRVVRAARRGMARPLFAPADRSPRRLVEIAAHTLNHIRKFRRYYPRPTDTGF